MKHMLIGTLSPFIMGNSAPVGGLLALIVMCIVGVGAVIGIIWGLMKFFSS